VNSCFNYIKAGTSFEINGNLQKNRILVVYKPLEKNHFLLDRKGHKLRNYRVLRDSRDGKLCI
jgi:hypothetical protein